mmetsp:Transcript_25397/g.85144  ORF Transcript_25397/g.85144 Transcript_25397/m.85144 type:complete len:296 (+) Transcript_25397:1236-2123(+)
MACSDVAWILRRRGHHVICGKKPVRLHIARTGPSPKSPRRGAQQLVGPISARSAQLFHPQQAPAVPFSSRCPGVVTVPETIHRALDGGDSASPAGALAPARSEHRRGIHRVLDNGADALHEEAVDHVHEEEEGQHAREGEAHLARQRPRVGHLVLGDGLHRFDHKSNHAVTAEEPSHCVHRGLPGLRRLALGVQLRLILGHFGPHVRELLHAARRERGRLEILSDVVHAAAKRLRLLGELRVIGLRLFPRSDAHRPRAKARPTQRHAPQRDGVMRAEDDRHKDEKARRSFHACGK